jgi:hypothetical protein
MWAIRSAKENKMKPVSNFCGVKNQFVWEDDHGIRYFQSYQTIIAEITINGNVFLDPKWNCSVTTSKYRAKFLGESTRETLKKIKSHKYFIYDLNQKENKNECYT